MEPAASNQRKSILDLIDDIFSSSEMAIEVLDELLQYENLDSGSFNMDMRWLPLDQLFAGKLSWARILAEKKGVNLTLLDATLSTEFSSLRKCM
jgi:hypothetical protein